MAVVANKKSVKSVMTLFSSTSDLYSHRVRIVLAEKGINFEIVEVDPANPPEDLMDLNPYGIVPTLVDRDLVLYDAQVIMEYLDERFPHPPLMPVDPVSRAQSRMTLRRIQRDWDICVDKLEQGKDRAKTAKELSDSLVVISVAPILWRLPVYGIELPLAAKPLINYAERLFELDSFQASLTEQERDIREA
jgi:RNA polymerase-associated protein